jgi:predicted nucleotide-binding protein
MADVTVNNANVFYELGLAHALGKDVFIIRQQGSPLPADFGGTHYYEYDRNDLASARTSLSHALARWKADVGAAGVAARDSPLTNSGLADSLRS